MCYVSEDRGLVYLAHPRTASMSMRKFLSDRGFKLVGNDHHGRRNGLPGVAFTVIRNPYDVMVSWWFNRNWCISFDTAFLDRLRLRAAEYFNPLWFHLSETDHIMRYENLESELSAFLGEPVELEGRNVSEKRKDRPYQEFYDEETRAYVKEWLSHEITFYGYDWG